MSEIYVAGWDADRVLYDGLSTSICAENSKLDPEPFLKEFEEKGWYDEEDVDRWVKEYNNNKPIERVADIARMLTDFLYSMEKDGESIITKEQTIEGKQALLRGLSMGEIIRISESIEYNPGVLEAVWALKDADKIQTLFSDGLGPHITYQKKKLGMNAGKGIPPYVKLLTEKEILYDDSLLCIPVAKLTGRVEKIDKAEEFFNYLGEIGVPLKNVAVIDDSASNIESLLLPVKEAGGIAVAYNPTEAHGPKFKEARIPILKGTNLMDFAEIVINPEKVEEYCET